MGATVCNLAKNCVGATVLAAPDSLQFAGSVQAFVGIMAINITMHVCTFFMMAAGCSQTGARTYRDWWLAVNGRRGLILLDLLLFLNGFSTLVVYVILVGDFSTKCFEGLVPSVTALHSRAVDVGAFTLLALLPLSLQRDLSLLAWASRFGLLCACYSAAYVVGEYVSTVSSGGSGWHQFVEAVGPSSFAAVAPKASPMCAFGILVAGTGSQVLTPKFFAELKGGTPRLYTVAALAAEVLASCFYLVFGLVGFARFGPSPLRQDGNILVNYKSATPLELLTWLSMAVNIVVMYPLQLSPVRESAIGLARALGVGGGIRAASKRESGSGGGSALEESLPTPGEDSGEFATCTMVIVALSVALGLQGIELAVINVAKGVLIMPLLCFVIPACLYRRGASKNGVRGEGLMNAFSWFCFVFGFIMMAKGVAQFAGPHVARHFPDAVHNIAQISFAQFLPSGSPAPAAARDGSPPLLPPPARWSHRGSRSGSLRLGP